MAARPGLTVVGDAIDKAKPAPRLGRRGKAEEEQRELPLLPAGCPVEPLGKLGQICHYLDEMGQHIALTPRDHGKTHIQSLFGRQADLCDNYWPRVSDKIDPETGKGRITGWMSEKAAKILQAACAHEGLFDPQGKIRGRGAWRDHEGELVLHCGDQVYRTATPIGDRWEDPGKIDGFVYPSAPAMPRPATDAADDTAGIELLEFLRCWYWERPKIDPYLLFGAIGHFPFGGACTWRSHVWVTGDTQTGKSTLELKLLAWLFEGLSLRCHDATEAALRQVLGQQTLPVFFDELEAEANNDRGLRVIKLARLASSGGVIFRGGSDHKAAEFTARSSFYFTSILMPPMLEQDRNRMAILELKQIPPNAAEPMLRSGHTLERARIVDLGRRLRRRVVDQWHRYEETFAAYRQALARVGHRGRSQDQFGTLLAFADLLLYDHVPELELLEEWAEALRADQFAETADSASDSEEACEFLARSMLQLRGGDEPEPLTRFLERAVGGRSFLPGGPGEVEKARERLENHGLRIVTAIEKPPAPGDPEGTPARWGARDPQPGEPIYLAIANAHEALARMFRDKRWHQGVWSQTFARAPGAIRRVQVKFAGKGSKATLVPIGAFLDAEEGK